MKLQDFLLTVSRDKRLANVAVERVVNIVENMGKDDISLLTPRRLTYDTARKLCKDTRYGYPRRILARHEDIYHVDGKDVAIGYPCVYVQDGDHEHLYVFRNVIVMGDADRAFINGRDGHVRHAQTTVLNVPHDQILAL